MNAILYTAPNVAALFIMGGCFLLGFALGAPLWVTIGRAWMKKNQPQAWDEAAKYQGIAQRKTNENIDLRAKLKAMKTVLEEI